MAWYTSAPWLKPPYETTWLVLMEPASSGTMGGRRMTVSVDSSFDVANIPAGVYEIHAYKLVPVTAEPLRPDSGPAVVFSPVKFVSETRTIQVLSGSKASVHLTMSDAATPHYPIPDPATCDIWVTVEQ